jgi:two-component system, cell cycle sensor histidine kinase PleC
MSHELRTPLNAIIGFSDMLNVLKISEPDRVQQYSGYIKQAAEHLLMLINGILDLSKIQAGKLTVEPETIRLEDALASCLLIVDAKAKEKQITIDNAFPAGMPPISADPLRVKQILINILSNAVKFTPSGGNVRIAAEIAPDDVVVIRVTDNGVGMSPQEIEIAKRPFGQVETSLNRTHEGTGLGLPISCALARLHGGELHIESEKGKGTQISIVLPLSRGTVHGEASARSAATPLH